MKRRKGGRTHAWVPPFLLAVSVALMFAPPHVLRPARAALFAATAPVELAVSAALDFFGSLPDRLRGSDRLIEQCRALASRNEELSTKVDYLKTQLLDRDKLIAQLADLKAFLPSTGYDILPAQVVGKGRIGAGSAASSFTLAIGSDLGVRRGDLVVTGYAVVGRVTSSAASVSQVQTVTDGEFRMAARTTPGGVETVFRGAADGRCLLSFVDARASVKTGDYVVTSGFDGLNPPGLLLGVVEKVQPTRNVRLVDVVVRPAANLDAVSQVIVVRRRTAK